MLRLQTLGSVFVTGDSGVPLGGAASQRRTLALLAALAIAGEGGLSRDKLVGLLWPDATPERARHSLTQALYAARRALGEDDLFLVNADVRLNSAVLSSDVQELEAALSADDLERAVALYRGPFLDGFFLSGSPEFEQWTSLQRARIEGRVTETLESLAEHAESQGSFRSVIDRRRRISAIRPLDSSNVVKLMTALMEVGDRAGALQHARLHELMLRQQVDLAPDAAVLALVSKLREPGEAPATTGTIDSPLDDEGRAPTPGVRAQPPSFERTAVPANGSSSARFSSAVELLASGFRPLAFVPVWLEKHLRHSWRLAAALSFGVAVVVLVLILRRNPPAPTPAAYAELHQKVVVAPFRVQGASSSLGYLRDGIVELLSTRLADDTSARAVDAGAVLRAWEDAGITTAAALPRDSIVKLAVKLGAERVVTGSVIGTPNHLIIRASVINVPSGSASGEAFVQGPADSIAALLDGLAARLLVAEAGEDERLASYTTSSLRGLRTYLAGQAAFRQNRYAEAIRLYDVALKQDSTFALAALRLAVAANRIHQGEHRRRGVAQAWASRDELSTWDRALLVALAGARFPLPASAEEELTVWRRLVELAPNDPESWYTLGANFFHSGAPAGVDEADVSAAASLERALSLDDGYVPAELLLAHLATKPQGAADRDKSSLDLNEIGDGNPFAPFLAWRTALTEGDSVALRRLRNGYRGLGTSNLRLMAMASQFDAVGTADGALALDILQTRAPRGAAERDLVLAQHSLAVQQGRPRDAVATTTRLASLQSASQGYLRLRVLDGLYAEGDPDATTGAARQLQRSVTGGMAAGAITSDIRLSNLCVVAQWWLSKGDTAGVARAIEALRRAGQSAVHLPPVSAAPGVCAELLDAWLATLMKRSDALAKTQRLDSLVLTAEAAGDAVAYAPILLARLHETAGHSSRALLAIRRRVYMSGWPRYHATAWREEGRLAELNGDRAGARKAYRRYLALRTSPERDVVPQVEQVRGLLAALGPDTAAPSNQ